MHGLGRLPGIHPSIRLVKEETFFNIPDLTPATRVPPQFSVTRVPEHRLGCQHGCCRQKGSVRGEVGTYLGNLCFSFLRLCLVGGTDTRHWAISSYWALVSIMLGQGQGDDKGKEKGHPCLEQSCCDRWAWGHSSTARCPRLPGRLTPCNPGCTSQDFTRHLAAGGELANLTLKEMKEGCKFILESD